MNVKNEYKGKEINHSTKFVNKEQFDINNIKLKGKQKKLNTIPSQEEYKKDEMELDNNTINLLLNPQDNENEEQISSNYNLLDIYDNNSNVLLL